MLDQQNRSFPVVGIGASAGGLEAVSELLTALTPETGMAWIVVQHLDPVHQSMLVELLGAKTRMAVSEAHDGAQVLPDHLYVIPPNATMTLVDGSLRLQARDTAEHRRMAVDILFRSLAQGLGSNAIGVILSGTGSDGARGLEEIKTAGGITFAQDEASARFFGMPRSAIDSGCVDFVLPAADIARELLRIKDHPYLEGRSSPSAADAAADVTIPPTDREDQFKQIFRAVRTHYGVDFSHYKRSTMERRLARRMALRQMTDLAEYTKLLQSERSEGFALGNDFLIRVTGFFRDPESFRGLMETVWPAVFARRPRNESVRIWVPGCSSGEEVYSVAISLLEYMAQRSLDAPIQIFGTDLSEAAIEKARAGIYSDNITDEVSGERLRRYFTKLDQRYQVAKSIRDICIFSRHDVTFDPPFSRLDLITCRNLLIYFDQPLQQRVLPLFHYALKPKAFLMLGPSESVGMTSSLFQVVDSRSNIYRNKKVEARSHAELRRNEIVAPPRPEAPVEMTALVDHQQAQREAERVLLARYGPACVLVDDNLDILYFHGETSRFLEHARGPASLNLKKLAPPSLLVELSTAIREVQSHGDSVRKRYLTANPASTSGENQVEVISVQIPGIEGQHYLILFEDGPQKPLQSSVVGWLRRWRTNRLAQIPAARTGGGGDNAQLRRELDALQNFLKVTIEEHEAAKEEMKSAHEELLSMNEEYLSTNEELETAKEELQSTNEELAVTNEELRNRNDELNRTNRDLKSSRDQSRAIIETMREGLLVLDSDFRVMQANHSFYECFDTRPQDTIGYSLFELGNRQWNIPLLHELLERVLPEKRILRDYEVTHTFPSVGERVMLLNARHLSEEHAGKEMILLAIEDITERLDAAKKADLRKNDFLSMLAHELRNPLTPIRNAAALLAARDANEDNARYHQVIDRQVNKLSRLIDDLLDVTRFTRGNIVLRKEPIDLVRVVNQAVEAHRLVIEERQIELSQSLPTTPLIVVADAIRLEQAIGDLLENAAKYTAPRGKIELTLGRDREAVLSIRDNGIGIAPEALPSIFEIFYQADSTLDRSRGGVGIGLSLARRLVEMHNGRLEAFSDGLGKGSEFVIRLPLADQPASALPLADADSARLAAPGAPARQVLIVDDNIDVADTMRELIVTLGHHAATAHDGRSALALIPTLKPDLGLIDIGLPDMVGYELARRIRGLPGGGQIFLIALTGYGREEDRKAALEAGFDRHLVKPITLRQIEELLDATSARKLAAVPDDGALPLGAATGDGGPTSVPTTSDGAKPADKSPSK